MDPGMEITEGVRVTVEARSSSLKVVCPTGVKALGVLFCICRERG